MSDNPSRTSRFIPLLVLSGLMLFSLPGCQSHPDSAATAAPSNAPASIHSTPPSDNQSPKNAASQSGPYKDGRYEATAVGYSGGLRVAVTIQGGNIHSIEILEHNEVGEQYYKPAMEKVPALIIEKQSVEGIDTVAGSTRTTKGIVKAVQKALQQAKP